MPEFDIGPLAIFACWQTLLFAIGVALISGGIKTLLDTAIGYCVTSRDKIVKSTGTPVSVGYNVRSTSRFLTRVLLPATPLAVGILMALFVPLRPDELTKYLAEMPPHKGQFWILAFYGMAVGVLSDYVYGHFKKNLTFNQDIADVAILKASIPPTAKQVDDAKLPLPPPVPK